MESAESEIQKKSTRGGSVIILETTLLDQIQVNGRISKKLYEKVVVPELDRLRRELKTKNEKIDKLTKLLKEANRRHVPSFCSFLRKR